MEQYSTLYIFNYQGTNEKYYFMTKFRKKYYFVNMNAKMLNHEIITCLSRKNQLYLIYNGLFDVDDNENLISLIRSI